MLDVLDIHTHTTASGHAYNTIYEMAQSASRKGLALLGISDHGPAMEGSASKHYFRSSRCIPRELYGVKILFGCELNIIDLQLQTLREKEAIAYCLQCILEIHFATEPTLHAIYEYLPALLTILELFFHC